MAKKEVKEAENSVLDKFLDEVEKKFGKGAVMNLEEGISGIEFISSGSLTLDNALGGGYPKGRIVEIYGDNSTGKCLTKDSYILTANDGYQTIENIFSINDLPIFTTNKNVEKKYLLVNEEGEKENTTHFTYNGKKKLLKITTDSGFVHKITYNHPLRVVDENGFIVWRKGFQLKKGDCLVGVQTQSFGKNKVSFEEAYSIGLLVADAHFGEQRLNVTNNDPDVLNFIENSMSGVLQTGFFKYKNGKNDNNSFDYHFSSKEKVAKFYEKTGLFPCNSPKKKLSKYIMSFDKESLSSFLCGYLDSESYIDSCGLEVSSASFDLLYQIKLILSQFNIGSTIKYKYVKKYPQNNYWRLIVSGSDFRLFIDEIGLKYSISEKQKSRMRKLSNKSNNCKYNIPNIGGLIKSYYQSSMNRKKGFSSNISDIDSKSIDCSLDKLDYYLSVDGGNTYIKQYLKTLKNKTFDCINLIEEIEEEATFDFAMAKTHTFIADGCINHNTTLTIHAMVECQKQGGLVGFVDAEHAFDLFYAKNLGLETSKKKFQLSQPSCGEEALEIVDSMVKTGIFSMVVVDSVAALTPRAEIEGEMGEAKMGLHARLMSQALRKLTSSINKTNTVVIFINQTRDKIGVMWGNPTTTTGGNALKFYASQRVETSRSGQTKDKEDTVTANGCKCKVIKNKVAPPFRTALFSIEFGRGIDKLGEIIDLAVEHDIIQKKGAGWMSYEETKLGQGVDAVKATLNDNPDLLDIITEKVKQLIAEK